jgi:hypothetical protein
MTMTFEHSLPLLCPKCMTTGEFVYERVPGYGRTEVTFKSLSRGFKYKSLGFLETVLITCLICHVKAN